MAINEEKRNVHKARTLVSFIALSFAVPATVTHAHADELPTVSPATTAKAAGMVSIQSLVADIRLDMRYAGDNNFVGKPVRGYEAAHCYLLKSVAEALQRVEMALRQQSMRLRIFDCYRPVRAVTNFVEWADDLSDQRTKPRYYPKLEKSELLGDYIAPTSGHSRGATLDLTLMTCSGSGECTSLDMGTDFDFFDTLANTDSPDITPQQQANRQRLRAAMQKEGFRNYAMEWWHYTFQPEPSKDTSYDFVVK
ncbi:MAG TPA: M15 family metallopeptidase [Povalibacter sp.]